MEITYRKNLGRSYMCIEEEGNLIESYELRMFENRNIPCLLRMQTVISEGKTRYLYDISGKQQIADYFSGKKMGYDFLQTFLFSIHEVCTGLPEYLLREEGICLQEELIYVNLEDGSLQFTYLPFYNKSLPEAFQSCMEQILRRIDHQDSAAVELGYQAYQLCIKENTNIEKLLETVLGKGISAEKNEAEPECANSICEDGYGGRVRRNKTEDKYGDCVRKNKTEEKGNMETGQKPAEEMDKEETGRKNRKMLAESGKSMILGEINQLQDSIKNRLKLAETMQKYLSGFSGIFTRISRKQGQEKKKEKKEFVQKKKECIQEKVDSAEEQEAVEAPVHPTEFLGVQKNTPMGKLVYHGIHQCGNIQIEGDVFLLGKNAAQVDGVIQAEGVSRLHARITRQEESYFIEDLNSTNGTYLNDMMLEYHQPKLLKPKDKVRFGVEEYVFL